MSIVYTFTFYLQSLVALSNNWHIPQFKKRDTKIIQTNFYKLSMRLIVVSMHENSEYQRCSNATSVRCHPVDPVLFPVTWQYGRTKRSCRVRRCWITIIFCIFPKFKIIITSVHIKCEKWVTSSYRTCDQVIYCHDRSDPKRCCQLRDDNRLRRIQSERKVHKNE